MVEFRQLKARCDYDINTTILRGAKTDENVIGKVHLT